MPLRAFSAGGLLLLASTGCASTRCPAAKAPSQVVSAPSKQKALEAVSSSSQAFARLSLALGQALAERNSSALQTLGYKIRDSMKSPFRWPKTKGKTTLEWVLVRVGMLTPMWEGRWPGYRIEVTWFVFPDGRVRYFTMFWRDDSSAESDADFEIGWPEAFSTHAREMGKVMANMPDEHGVDEDHERQLFWEKAKLEHYQVPIGIHELPQTQGLKLLGFLPMDERAIPSPNQLGTLFSTSRHQPADAFYLSDISLVVSAYRGGQWLGLGAELSASRVLTVEDIVLTRIWGDEPGAPTSPSAIVGRGPKLVKIPGGSFSMGASNDADNPVHHETVAEFAMDETEVTVRQYRACVEAGACSPPKEGDFYNWNRKGREQHPINGVNYVQAIDFCEWAGKRLPTEQEWEYAARGAEARVYPWGNAPADNQVCGGRLTVNAGIVTALGTCAVAQYPGGDSPFGLHDMEGNVQEWTQSTYCPSFKQKECEPEKSVRGRGWMDTDNHGSSSRSHKLAGTRLRNLGFRCAR